MSDSDIQMSDRNNVYRILFKLGQVWRHYPNLSFWQFLQEIIKRHAISWEFSDSSYETILDKELFDLEAIWGEKRQEVSKKKVRLDEGR